MTQGSRINFDEPIPEMIKRLKSEHKKFESNLVKVKASIEDNNITLASEIIQSILHYLFQIEIGKNSVLSRR